MKVALLTTGRTEKASGGGFVFVKHLAKALTQCGVDVDIQYDARKIKEADVIVLGAIGTIDDRNKAKCQQRTEAIMAWKDKAPLVVVRHDVREGHSCHDPSREAFKDFEFDLIVTIEQSDDMAVCLVNDHKFKNAISIPHPYDLDPALFEDRTAYGDRILSPARIDSRKHQAWILDMLKQDALFQSKQFTITGVPSGMYWYYCLSKHEARGRATWPGPYETFSDAAAGHGFMIDLTLLFDRKTKLVSGGRTQYTVLHAIERGLIPIGLDVWRGGGYDGIWLPTPALNKRTLDFDSVVAAGIISDVEYSLDLALANLESIATNNNLERIGEQWKEALQGLI